MKNFTEINRALVAKKNFNLLNLKWLLSYSHEKQSPQRFGRYAAMLIMLLTLGVGQMWAWNVTENKVYYFVPSSEWKSDNARSAVAFGISTTTHAWYTCIQVPGDENVYYVVSPGNYDWMILTRQDPANSTNSWDNRWNECGKLYPNNNNNKYDMKSAWSPDFNWYNYAPPMASVELSKDVVVYGGDGSEATPYLVATGSTISFSTTATSAVTADSQTKYYQFYKKEGAGSRSTWGDRTTTSTKSLTVSSSADVTYAIDVEAQNEYYSTYGTAKKSNVIYFKTMDPIYAVLGDFNSWTASSTYNFSGPVSNVYTASFSLNKGTYLFKAVIDNGYYGNGQTYTRASSSPSNVLSTSGGDMTITADVTGEYTFLFNFSSKTLSITYPTAYTISISHGWKAASGNFSANTNPASAKGGTITSAVASASGTITNGEKVASGESVVFTHSTAATGYSFLGWGSAFNNGTTPPSYTAYTHNGTTIVINDASNTLTLNNIGAAKNVYSFFKEHVTTVTVNAAAGQSGLGSLKFGATAKSWGATTTVGVTTTQSITAVPNPGYKFKRWTLSGGATLHSGSLTDATITIKGNGTDGSIGTAVAEFELRYAVVGSVYGTSVAGSGMPGWADYSKTMEYQAANDFRRTLTLAGNKKYKFRLRDKQTGNNLGFNTEADIAFNTQVTLDKTSADVTFSMEGSGDVTFKIVGFDGSGYPQIKVLRDFTSHTMTFGSGSFYVNGTNNNATTGGSVAAVDGYSYTITSGQKVKNGGSVVFTATPATGYTFEGWYSNNTCTTPITHNGSTIVINDAAKTLTLSSIDGNKTVYAKFVETSTAVTIAHNEHGHVEISNVTVTNTTVGKTTTRTIKAVPNPGYYFAGWTVPVGADFSVDDATEAGNNGSKSTTLRGLGAGTAGTITANFVELEKVYFRNWDEDNKKALWDQVYVYFSISYEDACAKSNSSADFKILMEREGTSNVYWAYVPRSTTLAGNTPIDYQIAFSDYSFGTNYKFLDHEAVMRSDYRTGLSMFVPRHSSTETKNGTKYYKGYWKHHNKAAGSFSGYSIVRYTGSGYVDPAKNGEDVRSFMVKDENTIQYSLRVDNLVEAHHNRFMIYSDAEIHYITYDESPAVEGYNITTANCTNVHMSEYTSGSPRFEIVPTSEGMYTLTVDMSSDEMKLSVNYPVAVGDYRLKHTYTISATTHTTYSDVIKSGATSTTASMYLNPSSSPTLVLEKCTNVSPLTWTQQGDDLWSTYRSQFDGKGVYQFDIAISNNAISSLTNVALYEGNFYIKTDCAPGGWTSYKTNILDKNTINFSKSDATTFDYYMCKNVGAGTNVKFVIANDYNIAITDSIKADATYLTGGNNENTPSEGSCVRFSYNSVTNEAKRAYMRYSNQTNFLNIIPSAASKVYDAASAGNDLYGVSGAASTNNKFGDDDGNFVYRKTVYAVSGASIAVKAEYTTSSQKQTFVTGHQPITSSNKSTRYPIQVVYDFKTNNLTTAWHPGASPISDEISKVDYMFIRDGQAAADQLSFGVGGALTDAKVCGAFQFDYDDYVGKVGAWPQQAGQTAGYTYSKCMFYFSFPFNVKVSDIFGIGTYGKEWKIQYYDGAERAKKGFFRGDGTTTFWKDMSLGDTLKAYIGYSLLLDNDYFNTKADGMVFNGKSDHSSVYLYFPSYQTMSSITSTTKDLTIAPLECKLENTWYDAGTEQTLSHKNTDSHWNMLGVPLLSSQTGDFSSKFTQSGLSYLYAWNPTTNTLSPAATGSGAGAVGNFTFQAMGAYMVQFTGTITFTGAVPTPSAIAARQKKETKNYTVDLEVLDGDDERINHTYVELRDGASDDFVLSEDMYMTRNSNAVNIYSFAGDYDVAANVLSLNNHVVPVGVAVKKAGTYKFSMPYEFSGTVTLVDKFNNTRTNLAFDEYEVYLEKGSINDRFDMEINIHKVPTSIENVDGNNALNDGGVHKFIENDQMYILKNGTIYNAQGAKVK